jgi:hypothetical protein
MLQVFLLQADRAQLHRELAIGLVTVVSWLSLYLFERSWVKWLGFSITLLIFLGGAVFILDRLLWSYRIRPKKNEQELLAELALLSPGSALSTGLVGGSLPHSASGSKRPAAQGPPEPVFPPPPWA